MPTLRVTNKLLGLDVMSERSGLVRLAALNIDNSLTLFTSELNAKDAKKEPKKEPVSSNVALFDASGPNIKTHEDSKVPGTLRLAAPENYLFISYCLQPYFKLRCWYFTQLINFHIEVQYRLVY